MAATQPISYSGQGFSLAKANRRFALPPQMRKALAQSSGTKIMCLAKHDRWPCLTAFGFSRLEDFPAILDREEDIAIKRGDAFDRDMREMQLHSFSPVPFDESGRFVLPDHFALLGRISERVFFQGAGSVVTLWNPDELARMGPGMEGAQAVCAMLAAEAAKARK